MKKITFFFCTIGILFLISSCQEDTNRHRDLINYLDSGSHHFTLDSAISDDAAIIALLTEVSKYNQNVMESNRNDTDKVDATNYLKNLFVFNQYLKEISKIEKISTETISLANANKYHNNYLEAREDAAKLPNIPDGIKKDISEATLFTLPKLIAALQNSYDPEPSDWIDTSWWQQKGFFIFLSNYGSTGHADSNIWQSSSIFQLAQDVPDSIPTKDSWEVRENQLYNFGDLKPPKIRISNFNLAPKK